jgi:hypothetical protein
MTEETTKRRLIPLTRWNDYHPYPSVSALRAMVFHATTNGFDKVIRRVGKRILLDEAAWFQFVDQQKYNQESGV